MAWNCDHFSDFLISLWHEPFRHRTIKLLSIEFLRMSDDEFLPEHRVRSEYFPLLTLVWLDHKKVLKTLKIYVSIITYLLYILISRLPSWRIRSIPVYRIDLIFLDEVSHDFLRLSSIDRDRSSMRTDILIDMFECLTDKSESHISLTEVIDRSFIMDKDRKYFFRVFHRFDESSIVMSSEILTEDEESTVVLFLHDQSIAKNREMYILILCFSHFSHSRST
jgi:hypothetical protein